MTSDRNPAAPPPGAADLEHGLACHQAKAWDQGYVALARADAAELLSADHLEALAMCAGLSGRDEAHLAALERMYALHVEAGERVKAAEAAFWKGFRLMAMGEMAQGSGWFVRAERLIEGEDDTCAVRGYLEIATVRRLYLQRDYEGANRAALAAAAIGERAGDVNLTTFARNLMGRTLLRQGRIEEGLRLHDESMIATTTGGLSPVVTALIYCSAIASCGRIYALDRTREWTAALAGWCDSQPELVAFTGTCCVLRAEILQLGGDWTHAFDEAARAVLRTSGSAWDSGAEAHYQQAEVHRLRGERDAAEQSYKTASQLGRDPQPGLALLRLSQGNVDAAHTAIRRVLGGAEDPLERARLAPAAMEILIAARAFDEARPVVDQLEATAQSVGTEALAAMAAHARGALLFAEGDAQGALAPLRRAFRTWQKLGAPYIAARIRVTLARACHALEDCDGAELELSAARDVFERLGAAPDLATLDAGPGPAPVAGSSAVPEAAKEHGLTARELEVLRLVASGKTNKVIAADLGLSEKTVDRHLSNIFSKIDVSSRAGATAFAYENALI